MRKYQGIIFAYREEPELRELTANRTAASLPFCGRYRLIDFPLSSLRNAGVLDVGVIMQRDYQSLLDHIGSGKAWDMSRRSGGLRMLPPFGLPQYHNGNYNGTMEALNAVGSYLRDSSAENVILMLGSVAANIDLAAAIQKYEESDADALAICMDHDPMGVHHRFNVGPDGYVNGLNLYRRGAGDGLPSLEAYIFRKDILLELMDYCRANNHYLFHRDAITLFLSRGGKMTVYVHEGYANSIRTVDVPGRPPCPRQDPRGCEHLLRRDGPFRQQPGGRQVHHRGRRGKLHHLLRRACGPRRQAARLHHHEGLRRGRGRGAELCDRR